MENFNQELLEKAKQTKSAEELLALAKENGVEMNEEQANAYFAQLHKASGEISDDELNNVSGGGCHSGDGRLVVTIGYECSHWVCTCGNPYTRTEVLGHSVSSVCTSCGKTSCCNSCRYMSYERGLWLCNNPANKT